MKKVEEEWKKRMENECRAVRDAGDHETENTHLRNVALKAQLVEVQSKLQVRNKVCAVVGLALMVVMMMMSDDDGRYVYLLLLYSRK